MQIRSSASEYPAAGICCGKLVRLASIGVRGRSQSNEWNGKSTSSRKTNSDGHESRVHFRRLLGDSLPTTLVTDPPGGCGSDRGFSVKPGSARKVYFAH